MKKWFILAGISLLLAGGCTTGKKFDHIVLPLESGWKFSTGDNPGWAGSDFDDSGWETFRVDQTWENQGFENLDGFAWYRIRFTLPGEMKDKAYLKDEIEFRLGKIDDYDQVFLNGQIIGINSRTSFQGSPSDTAFIRESSQWNTLRSYVIPAGHPAVMWGKENVIAVRVYDSGGAGGMFAGEHSAGMKKITSYLVIDYLKDASYDKDRNLVRKVEMKNISPNHGIVGNLIISAELELTGQKFYQNLFTIKLGKGESKAVDISIPGSGDPGLITYRFAESQSGDTLVFQEGIPYILTPPAGDVPRIHGALVTGVRPGNPFLYTIPATGREPLRFEAGKLPRGLTCDPETGIISGKIDRAGSYNVLLTVRNSLGEDARILKIRVGDTIALTPPMGWNSWNCWGLSVDENKVIASARTFIEKGLIRHGWSYINIDDGWEIPWDSPQPKRDAAGRIIVNEKFPDMKALGDTLHRLGLKFGIYSSPGPYTCGGYTASYRHEMQDAASFASWGVDYLKYDWCSYGNIAKDRSLPELKKPYHVMRDCLKKVNRDIVYSLCQYGMGDVWTWGADVGGNLWRTTGDIWDSWESMRDIGFSQVTNAPFAGPGHWNDPDMLVVGWVGWGPNLHPTRLTPNEQYTHITLWCMLSAPLLIGCDLERLDEFTLNLLTNDEVLAIDQDPLGKQAVPLIVEDSVQVWVKELEGGGKAIALFNLDAKSRKYTLRFSGAGLNHTIALRDLWRQKDLGQFTGEYETVIPAHGTVMLRVNP